MEQTRPLELLIDGYRVNVSAELIEKYDRPGPRYTSYPTAPEWSDSFGPAQLSRGFQEADSKVSPAPLSLYVHLPFCESLCLFCGCNVTISKNQQVAVPYLERLKQEIDRVSAHISPDRKVEQLHWGGGTPTFLSPDQIEEIYSYIRSRFAFAETAEVGVEVDPRATTEQQCRVLARLGFNRLSMGVQDFDPAVQKAVHRVQPYDMTKSLFDYCRALGFQSINIDLIYGLPKQTLAGFARTVDKIIEIDPDRIALFSYAHVPWLKKQQGSFARHLPDASEKFAIFCHASRELVGAGYRYIGMDHFARPDDELCLAQDGRTLHRNFQGYTTRSGCDLYGFGVSAISGLEDTYAQNQRELARYYDAIDKGQLATMRGIRVSKEDKIRRSVINGLLCNLVVVKSEVERDFRLDFDRHFSREVRRLAEFEEDGLVRLAGDRIEVVGLGRIFIRNVAMVFDAYLNASIPERKFSRTL